MTEFNELPEEWAKDQATSEADAFESALRAITIKEKKTIFEPDDDNKEVIKCRTTQFSAKNTED